MERFGASPGDPFTTKEIQHIGIAVRSAIAVRVEDTHNVQVMFWFAGLLGMGIESKRIRKWLAASIFSPADNNSNYPDETITEPSSYKASFNPFPALVIGVTGSAMAAHLQTYLFQVCCSSTWKSGMNLLISSIGSDSCSLGQPSSCLCRLEMLDLLLRLAGPSSIGSSLTTAY